MENPHPAPGPGKNKGIFNSTFCFAIGWAALFMMALLWSLDAAFFYMLLGLACVFFFVGYWNRVPEASGARSEHETYKSYYQRTQRQAGPSFWQTLTNTLKNQTASSRPAKPVQIVASVQRKLAIAIFAAIGGVFMIIFLSVVFGSGESATDNFQQAEQYYLQQEYNSALQYYRRSFREDPENTGAMLGYGKTLAMLDQADSAHMMYDKIMSIDPGYDMAYYNKAALFFHQKNHAMAAEVLKNLIARNPSYVEAYQLLGDVHYDQQSYDEAMLNYQAAYDGGLRSRWLCHVMAYLHDVKGETPRAIDLYQEALTYDSAVTEIYQRLGELIPGEEGEAYRLRVAGKQW